MTPSMTAWPPTRVSSPLSRIGSNWTCRNSRKKFRRNTRMLVIHYPTGEYLTFVVGWFYPVSSGLLKAADGKGDNVVNPHRFLHCEGLTVFHADQITVKPRDGGEAFANLRLIGKQRLAFFDRTVLRAIGEQRFHSRFEISRDIDDERRRHIRVDR